MNTQTQHYTFKVDETLHGQRLDKALSTLCSDLSRSRLQALIKGGQVSLNGINDVTASEKVEAGDRLNIVMPPLVEAAPQAQNITLDIVYEDDHLLVINKPVGLVVHPGAGNHDGTLVNALLHHCGDTLSGIGGVIRPGIVHRLDKDTTGLMVVAKNDHAHQHLSAQLADRSLSRIYHALVMGTLMPPMGYIDKPIGRDLKNRQKMAITAKNSREAVTHYRVIEAFNNVLSLVECQLETGRTHQIRVHMAHNKHSLIGDPLYGAQPTAVRAALKRGGYEPEVISQIMAFERQALHAKELSFIHPASDEEMHFESELPDDFKEILRLLSAR